MNRDEIIEKIRALFRLGDTTRNNSRAEAMAAVEAAKRLMAKHHVEMAEVALESQSQRKLARADVIKRRFSVWHQVLASAVGLMTGTNAIGGKIFNKKTGKTVRCTLSFFGELVDVQIAAALWVSLEGCIDQQARVLYSGRKSFAARRNFAEGFTCEVERRARQISSDVESNPVTLALVIDNKRDWARRELDRLNGAPLPEARPGRIGKPIRDAFLQGMERGAAADLAHEKRLTQEATRS